MITRVRRTAAAITAVAGLGIGSAVWATSAASAASTTLPPACTSGNLSVWVDANQSSGAAGTIAYALEFTNISGHACRTSGYPGVSATNANGKQLGDAAGRIGPIGQLTAVLVTIPAGGTAHADLFYGDAEVSTSGCKPTTASRIKVYPPDQRSAKIGFFDLPVCTLKHHTYLRVTVIQSGPRLDA